MYMYASVCVNCEIYMSHLWVSPLPETDWDLSDEQQMWHESQSFYTQQHTET